MIFAYDDSDGPLLPEGTPEFGEPGSFNRWYPVRQAELKVHDARVALDVAQRALQDAREIAEQSELEKAEAGE